MPTYIHKTLGDTTHVLIEDKLCICVTHIYTYTHMFTNLTTGT